ncbi:hypothetical protein RUM43_001283, partial [Polyplax serrata]
MSSVFKGYANGYYSATGFLHSPRLDVERSSHVDTPLIPEGFLLAKILFVRAALKE